MTTLSERIQEILDAGHSQAELYKAAKVSKGTPTQWLNGQIKSMKYEYAQGIELATGFSATWITTGAGPKKLRRVEDNVEPGPDIKKNRQYPVISWVQAGQWTELCDNFQPGDADEWKPCHKDLGECGYVLRVKGKSMTAPPGEPFTFPEGILLYVNAHAEALPGKFVIVRRNTTMEATFKRLITVDGELYLEALNPEWPNRYLKLEEGDEFCGVVQHAGFDMP
ncbi:LexA family protein [Paucimonas lemoignei]|nr:S24 family peptidase [Paucimonas lemoignei]